ncbi:MAG: hypothetical protein JOY81_07665, partial [Alphaproteobacteria bacterium]|nr:hypothetical protein [Alphaproteobacteria bacterium]
HAIRADMVERLAAMARQAVRESREAAKRAQHESKKEATAKPAAPAAEVPAKPSASEISEWEIVAASFGELPAEAPVDETPKAEEQPPVVEAAMDVSAEAAAPEAPVSDASSGETPAAPEAASTEATTEEVKPEETKPEAPKRTELPPGHFRATPQMMSLVGCSEPEMANVLRGLGYRVMAPEEEGGVHTFSVKPRFVREREEQRARQRQQQREQRDQRRRERPDRPNERQFFADGPHSDQRGGPKRDEQRRGPRPDRKDGPPQSGTRQGQGQREDRPRDERRGPRPPRRDQGGPALRLYATTEKKGDAAADSPFAKLLELKLGGKQ